MGVRLVELTRYLGSYLEVDRGGDYAPNGLQVEGRAEVNKLVTGVSACLELFERARDVSADVCLVHHGIFWKGQSPVLTGVQYGRVRLLIDSGISLLAYHLPLDAHREVGNNAIAARELGLMDLVSFARHEGLDIGVRGRFPQTITASDLVDRVEALLGQKPLAFLHGPDPLSTMAIVSGAAEGDFRESIALGVDAFLTGEVSEWVMNLARESGTHFLAGGHYATERLGVQALGRHLGETFDLDVEFIDVPNPV
ncbi:MAG TPA: Nif3-like dinuclear metal center hexameric protein [Thermoanaerobaculia bacterium]|nr:Nif3-like dinuclear metal center hexameric protein [Thermoanaerobaculia bacterium]